MWWKKKATPPLRDQLLAARADLSRQIDVLRAGPSSMGKGGAFIDNSGLIVELRSQLAQIDEALTNA